MPLGPPFHVVKVHGLSWVLNQTGHSMSLWLFKPHRTESNSQQQPQSHLQTVIRKEAGLFDNNVLFFHRFIAYRDSLIMKFLLI